MKPEAANRETVNRDAGALLVFDGDCGFCTSSARWIQRKLPAETRVEPWQALDLDELGLTVADVVDAAWWFSPARSRPARGHEAIGWALAATGGVWRAVGKLIVYRPVCWLARPVYALVARNRHRMPGGTPACQTPAAPE